LSKDAALRSNVASSNFHFGEASCQMSFAKSCRIDSDEATEQAIGELTQERFKDSKTRMVNDFKTAA
jgi:hypothetical protein